MNEILPVLQQANAESRLQVDDHDPTAATESNKLLEDVNSLFKEVIDGIPDLVGGVDELKTKLVQTLTYNVSPQETEVGNDNAEMKETMDVDIEDGKYCLDDMSIGFEEDTSNGEIKVTLYQEDHKALCNKMDVAIEGKTLVTETSPVIETRVVDSTLKYQIMNMPEENLVKVNDTTSLKMGFYVVRRKRKPGVALQSPYEQQQSTTPTPAKKGEQLQKKKDGEPTMNCSNWLGIHMALLLMINSGFGWSCYGALDHRMQIEHNKAHCCKPYWLVVIPIYHANAKRGSVSWTDVDKELKASKDKLKAKTEKIDSLSESYKKRIEFVRKLEVITDIKIITNTKPLKVIVIKDNDDSNFKVISEFKWRLFGYKEWEITLVVLNKKKGGDVVELVKTLEK
ncbi:hypothetical protein Tco_1316591 [Tanacetum coccineum]